MKLNFHFFVVLFIALVAILCDLLIYITKIDYGIALCLSAFICTIITIFLFKKKSIKISFDFEKNDIFIFILFLVFMIAQSCILPNYIYDVRSYHIYLQENPFIDKINFDFFPGRIYCDFLFPLGDRMQYIFRYLLGYRLGTILSYYVIIILYYQVKKILQHISNNKKSKSIYAYFILTIIIVFSVIGSYHIDNFALIFLLELFYIVFCKDDLIKNKKMLYFASILAGISIGIKVSSAFFVAIIAVYGIIKNRKDLKALKVRDFFISTFLILIPFAIYLYDNYRQTGSVLFPYYNSILKSEYFGSYNWVDPRFTDKNIFFDSILWPLNALLIKLDYGHAEGVGICREIFVACYYIFTYVFMIVSIVKKKFKSILFKLAILAIISTFVWIYFLEGYVRYGLIVWCMYLFVFLGSFMNFIEFIKEKIKLFLLKHKINYRVSYKRICTFVYYLMIFALVLSAIVTLCNNVNFENVKHMLSDRRNESNIIRINGVWGTISKDGIAENSAFPALVRDENTPIYNLNRDSFASSEKTLEMFYERIRNNDIYVLFDAKNEDFERNVQVNALKSLNYEIVSIERYYTIDDISYIDADTFWVLAKVKYVGD